MSTTEQFDPYYTWLGIRPEEQPADHYRLLGVSRFEGNAEVIEHAADRQMSHLRSLQTGKFAVQGQAILNQVSRARICLLDPQQKANYDQALVAQMSAATAQAGFSTSDMPYEPLGDSPYSTSSSVSPVKRKSKRDPSKGGPSIIAAVFGAGAAGAIFYFVLLPLFGPKAKEDPAKANGTQPEAVASVSPKTNPEHATKASETTKPVATSTDPANGEPKTVDTSSKHSSDVKDTKVTAKPSVNTPSEIPARTPLAETKSSTKNPLSSTGTAETSVNSGESTNGNSPTSIIDDGKEPEPKVVAAPKRTVVPGEAALQKSEVDAKELFAKELAAAKKSAEKSQLAATLLSKSAELGDDLTGQYVLLAMGRDLAVTAGDPVMALKIIDRINAKYDIDGFKEKSELLTRLLETATSAAAQTALVEAQLSVVDEAVSKEDYPTALALARAAYDVALKTKDVKLASRVKDRGKDLNTVAKEFTLFSDANKTLQTTPDDPAANLAVGRWNYFTKQEPEKAWAYLAKGSDASLKIVAEKEIAAPTEAMQQSELADAWYELVQITKVEIEKNAYSLRASQWYSKALPQITGLAKAKAEKRVADLQASAEKVVAKPADKTASGAVATPHGKLVVGIIGEYYNGKSFDTLIGSRIDTAPGLGFAESRGSNVPPEEFSIRWIGFIVAPKAGTYKIRVVAKDGVRISVDGKMVIDQWKETRDDRNRFGGKGGFPGFPGQNNQQGDTRTSNKGDATVALSKQPLPVKIEYFQARGDKSLSITWEQEGGFVEQAIPPQAFSHEPPPKKTIGPNPK